MPNWYIRHTVDLETFSTDKDTYTSPLYLMLPGDNGAHVWSVSVFTGKDPVDITGQTVQAFFTRADGNTVVVQGTAAGNAAMVTLPRDVYLIRGELRAVMRLGDSVETAEEPVITLKEAVFHVRAGFTSLVDPSDSFPTLSGLAEDMQELEGTVTTQGTAITQIRNQITSQGWQDLGAASGVSAGTASMGTKTGFVCAYRVENGNHVIAAANVATSSVSYKVLCTSAIPEEYRPSSRIVRTCPMDGTTSYCRAYVERKKRPDESAEIPNAGMIVLEAVGTTGTSQPPATVNWTDIIIDWYVDD